MSETIISRDFLEEVVISYYLCYNYNNAHSLNAPSESWQNRLQAWETMSPTEREEWINRLASWMQLYIIKYPHHYNRIIGGFKKVIR